MINSILKFYSLRENKWLKYVQLTSTIYLDYNCLCVCINVSMYEASKNVKDCISGITQLKKYKFGKKVKPKCPFLQYDFCQN